MTDSKLRKQSSAEIFDEIRRNQLIIQSLVFFCIMIGTIHFVIGIAQSFLPLSF